MSGHVIGSTAEIVEFSATPAAPPAGYVALYAKTDDALYSQTPGGVETKLGGGSVQRTFAFFAS